VFSLFVLLIKCRKTKGKKKGENTEEKITIALKMEELSFNFNSPNNRGSSLFKFASFKHSNSKEKLESGGGLIPLEYIVEQLDDEIAQIPIAPRLLPSTSSNVSGEKKALPKRQAKKKKREDFSDEEDDEVDEEEPVDEEDDDRRSTRGKQHVDITEYLCLPQSDAAVKLGLPGIRKQKHGNVFLSSICSFYAEQAMEGVCQDAQVAVPEGCEVGQRDCGGADGGAASRSGRWRAAGGD
jgi:hypothetical protein